MKTKRLNRIRVETEVVKTVDLDPIYVTAGTGDAIRLRVELLRGCGSPRRIFARIWRKEFYRIKPSFPQAKGKPTSILCDELVFVEETNLVPDPRLLSGTSTSQVLKKVIKAISAKLDAS